MSNLANVHTCGLLEIILFILAILFGTGCSICSKTMMSLTGTNGTFDKDGMPHMESFQKPLFQTFGMFVGMLLGLVMHWLVVAFKLPFPGYEYGDAQQEDAERGPTERTALKPKSSDVSKVDSTQIPTWMYFFLAIPAIFDLVATALCMMGLQYLDVSIYQMLRGSGIIFVALMKQHVLKEHLQTFHWVGVFWNVVSVVIVGATALLGSGGEEGGSTNATASETFLGVCLMMAGAFVQALQFVFEEHVMKMDVPAPPLLLIGMEGKFVGVLIRDHGGYFT
jgi:drug/metabolite transporter (DMT)-like permease